MRIAIESKRRSEGLHQFDRPGFEIEHLRYGDLKRLWAVDRDRLVGATISQAACRVGVMQTNEFRGHDDSSDLGGWILRSLCRGRAGTGSSVVIDIWREDAALMPLSLKITQ
jgi:hypothetical protein